MAKRRRTKKEATTELLAAALAGDGCSLELKSFMPEAHHNKAACLSGLCGSVPSSAFHVGPPVAELATDALRGHHGLSATIARGIAKSLLQDVGNNGMTRVLRGSWHNRSSVPAASKVMQGVGSLCLPVPVDQGKLLRQFVVS